MHTRRFVLAFALLSACGWIQPATAQTFPAKPIRLIVPFAPGGAADTLGRIMARKMSEQLGQPIVVENHAGAGGTLGTDMVLRSPPDGYTITLNNTNAHVAARKLYPALKYDPVTGITPLGAFGVIRYVLVVNPAFPAKDYAAFVKLIQAQPDKYNYASAGMGSGPHLAMEMLKKTAALKIVHVPYGGSGPALKDVVGGHVPISFDNVAAVPLVKSGQLVGLAVTGRQRSAQLPGVPTFAEAGLADFDVSGVFGMLGPRGMPEGVVAVWSKAIVDAASDPGVQQQLAAQGIDPYPLGARDYAATIAAESERWSRLIEDANIKL